MAELIDKSALLKDWKKLPVQKVELVSCDDIYRNRPLCDLALVYEMITNAPTTTESEIRAKAYDRFMKEIEAEYDNDACPNVADYLDYKISLRDLFRIAEQLKEEQ